MPSRQVADRGTADQQTLEENAGAEDNRPADGRANPSPTVDLQSLRRPSPRLLGVYALRTLVFCLLGPWFLVAFAPLYFKYKTLRYRFEDNGVGVSWGVLWKREIYLTYARIQDIHVSRGLFERWLGVATIHIQTASGTASAEMSLVGLTEHVAVQEYLYSRMRGAHQPAELGGMVQASGADSPTDPAVSVLREVVTEVRGLRQELQRLRP